MISGYTKVKKYVNGLLYIIQLRNSDLVKDIFSDRVCVLRYIPGLQVVRPKFPLAMVLICG